MWNKEEDAHDDGHAAKKTDDRFVNLAVTPEEAQALPTARGRHTETD